MDTFSPGVGSIDHIDRNRKNNRLDNLRRMPAEENSKLADDADAILDTTFDYYKLQQKCDIKQRMIQILEQKNKHLREEIAGLHGKINKMEGKE